MTDRILVAGIGNIFLGDDGFGVEVVRRLAGKLPASVRLVDFGIRGLDLAFALMDGHETTILVDAISRNGTPGTIYTIEPDLAELALPEPGSLDAHSLDPVAVLSLARSMGAVLNRVLVVGCEPASLGDEESWEIGLSAPVKAAVEEAVGVIESLVSKLLSKPQVAETSRLET